MALGEAKAKAKLEFKDVLQKIGKSADELRACVAQNPELSAALYQVPKYKGVIGTAANFAIDVAEKMGTKVPYHMEAHWTPRAGIAADLASWTFVAFVVKNLVRIF